MRTPRSCGPDAVAAASGRSAIEVDAAWGIRHIASFGDLQDSPWHHWVVLERLGLKWQPRTLQQILSGEFVRGKAVVLLHASDDPATLEPEQLTMQHWAIIESIDTSAQAVNIWLGDGLLRSKPISWLTKAYSRGSPACAYEIGRGDGRTTWYQRLYVAITNSLFGG
jgi:hypothetical protein